MGFIADIFTADKAADAQKDAARDSAAASKYATDQTVNLQRDIFNRIWNGTQVQRDAGDAATRLMAQIMGLNLPAQNQTPIQPTNPRPGGTGNQQSDLTQILGARNIGNRNALALEAAPAMAAQTFPAIGGPQTQPLATGSNALASTTTSQQPFNVTEWLRSTPGYEANYTEGMRALNTGLASQGRLFSGDAGRESIRYGQQYADRIFGDQFNRLAAIAGAGQTATSQGSQAGQNYANNAGQAYQQNALNLGSSYQQRGNAISGFWGNVNGSINNAGANLASMFMGGF